MDEYKRIREVYASRDSSGKDALYSWSNLHSLYQLSIKNRMILTSLRLSFGNSLSNLAILDVGCGSGVFLRQLLEWGVDSANCVGTEFLSDRVDRARQISPKDIYYHLGGLDFNMKRGVKKDFDLVSAHMVFSSILDEKERRDLADQMWNKTCSGGWIMIFDFRYNNPSNSDVCKVTRKELDVWWPGSEKLYLTGVLAPPLARKLAGEGYLIAELLTLFFPFLRSHFVYMVKKPHKANN
jgi:SAM-dependent methyltransferase